MDSSPPNSSITRESHPQSLPYDFFESPDKQPKKFTMDPFLDETTFLNHLPKPRQEGKDEQHDSPPNSPLTAIPRISMDSMDFPSPRRVSDLTLSQYIIREIPDLPIIYDRVKQFFKDLLGAIQQAISSISISEWRKFFVLLGAFLQAGIIIGFAALKDAFTRIISFIVQVTKAFLMNILVSARNRVADWYQELRYPRNAAPGNGYHHF